MTNKRLPIGAFASRTPFPCRVEEVTRANGYGGSGG